MVEMRIFATRMKHIREKMGLTQAEMAKILRVSRGSIGYYENMERIPDIGFLVRVSETFYVSFDYLLGHSNNMLRENADVGARTGLSDGAIDKLEDRDFDLGIFNTIIESDEFVEFLSCLNLYAHLEAGEINFDYEYARFLLTKVFLSILEDICLVYKGSALIGDESKWDKMSPDERKEAIRKMSTKRKETREDLHNFLIEHDEEARKFFENADREYQVFEELLKKLHDEPDEKTAFDN